MSRVHSIERHSSIGVKNMEVVKMNFETLVSKKELVVALGVSHSFVNKLMAKDELPHFKIGRTVRFRISDISTWLEQRKVQ